MSNLRELYEKMLTGARLQGEVARAKEDFAWKPFAVEYRPLFRLSSVARWFLACFSVVTGFGYLYANVLPVTVWWLAGIIAAGLLLLIELLKTELAGAAFRAWYGSGRFPFAVLPAALVFAVSVFCSLQGVQVIYKQADGSGAALVAGHRAQLDSISTSYGAAIARAENEMADFKQSVSWKGKINLYNQTTANTIERYGARIAQLRADQRAAIAALQAAHLQQIAAHENETGANMAFWGTLAGCVEVSIICCLWFGVYYAYRLVKDSEILATGGENYTVTLQDVRELLGAASWHGVELPAARGESQPGQIGFRTGGSGTGLTGVNPVEKAKNAAFLAKYRHVVNQLEKGSGIAECAEICNVSRSTVKNVKRCLQAAQTTGQ